MSLRWKFLVSFMYFEALILISLLLPNPSRDRVHPSIKKGPRIPDFAHDVHNSLTFIALIPFIDSVMKVYKLSITQRTNSPTPTATNLETEQLAKLFRAQRNLFISGFTIFLWIIIKMVSWKYISSEETEIVEDNRFKLG
uniref:Endoplasmic reticulum transmembrane protein n=1 Tax=Crassostrea virginica TaxID=6565 RepID=A0A8B8BHA7_CRAVI|nr:B-cell receptor-associated protein 29-like [Crassostrea virginica]